MRVLKTILSTIRCGFPYLCRLWSFHSCTCRCLSLCLAIVFKFIRVSLHEWRLLTLSLRLPRRALPPAGAVWGLVEFFFDFVTFLRMTTDFIRGVYRGESPCRFIEFSLKFCLSLFLRFSSFFHACLVKVAFTLTMRFNSSLFSEFIFSVCFLLRAVDASCIRWCRRSLSSPLNACVSLEIIKEKNSVQNMLAQVGTRVGVILTRYRLMRCCGSKSSSFRINLSFSFLILFFFSASISCFFASPFFALRA